MSAPRPPIDRAPASRASRLLFVIANEVAGQAARRQIRRGGRKRADSAMTVMLPLNGSARSVSLVWVRANAVVKQEPYRDMKPAPVFLAALSVLLLPSCQNGDAERDTSSFDFEAASEMITAKTKQFTESHITGDLEFLDNVFTHDARVYPPGSDKIATQADISAVNAQYVNEYGVSEFTEVSTNRYGGPDFVVDEGTYTMTYGPDDASETGHYINIWKQVDGDWKLFANMWTAMPEETD